MTTFTAAQRPAEHPFLRAPNRTLFTLSLPVMLSLIAEPLTGLVDTAFVAQIDAVALAALGVGATVLSSTYWVFNFLSIGVQTQVAQALGKGRSAAVQRVVTVALLLGAVIGLLLIALVMPSAASLARLLGASADGTDGGVLAGAVIYTRIRILGAPAILLTLTALGAMRGWQDMRTPMVIAVGVNLLNVLLDPLLIFGFSAAGLSIAPLGIAGAAWASTISQWLGATAALAVIARRLGVARNVRWEEALHLFVVGRDLFLRTGLLLFFLALATRVANQAGAESGAANQAIRQIFIFTAFVLEGLAATAQSLVAYFIGAKLLASAKRVVRLSLWWGLGVGTVLAALLLVGQPLIERLLVPPAALTVFGPAWIVGALTLPFNTFAFITDGVHWGTGDYAYLRNAMLLSTAAASAALLLIDPASPHALLWIMFAIALWIVLRGALGVIRIWPGVGDSPFAPASSVRDHL